MGHMFLAGLGGASGVALGAFGAHALKKFLEKRGSTKTWETAVQYHLVHSVALLAVSTIQKDNWHLDKAAQCFGSGILLFSGSLYGLALGGPRILGPVTPLGGLMFIAGWLFVMRAGWSS